MLDIKYIRENPDKIKLTCKNKQVVCDIDRILELDKKRRNLLKETETLKAKQNKLGKENQEEAREIKNKIKELLPELKEIEEELSGILDKVPNIISEDTPIGPDESGNKVIRKWGEKPKFDFTFKDHLELGEELDIIDVKRAAKVSGTRFNYLKGGAVLIQFALIQYVFSVLTNEKILKKILTEKDLDISSKPFIPVVTPVMIKPKPFQRMARLEPREERYYIPKDDMYLIGSAEHTLGSMHMDEVFNKKDMPVRYIGYSTAFRREAGAYGQDTRGILRVHQFDKLEMESFSLPENGLKEQDFIINIQEYLVRKLELPYRVVMICTGDMGAPDYRQVDIETWLPGQNQYRETHTSDYMTDYQSRRLNIRVRNSDGDLDFVHMNDATAIAIGRILIAIIENYQQKDGSIKIPKVLREYMYGMKKIG